MRKLKFVPILLLLAPCLHAQALFRLQNATGGPFVAPTFVQYTFVAETNSTPVASITSPAITLTAGDFTYVSCRNGGSSVADVVTSSPANTFTPLTLQNLAGLGTLQASYSFGGGAGSTTFTCTPTTSQAFQSMVVLQYHPGSTTVLDTQVGGSVSANTTWTSPSFTTTAAGLVIACASTNNSGVVISAGTIGGTSANLRGAAAASTGSASDQACEDLGESGAQVGITATLTTGSVDWVGTVGAFK